MCSNSTRRKIFGLAAYLWQNLTSDQRLERLRALAAEINPPGGLSLSKLSSNQYEALLIKIKTMIDARRYELSEQWNARINNLNPVNTTGYATQRQLWRVKAVAVDVLKSPDQVEGILRSKFNIDSFAFAIPTPTINGILNILESYRTKRRTYRYSRKSKPRNIGA